MLALASKPARWAYAAVAAALGALAAFLAGRSSGRVRHDRKAMRDSIKRQEKGREAVSDLRGAGRDDLVRRLRDNDGEW